MSSELVSSRKPATINLLYYKNYSGRMPRNEAIGSYSRMKISKLKKHKIPDIVVPKFR